VHALAGHPIAAERWADAAEHGASGPLPDGSGPLEGWLALLRAALCRHGVERMRTDAEVALVLAPSDSPLRATLLMLLGVSHLLSGDPGIADDVLAEAVAVAEGSGATDTAVVALAERAILAIGRREWSEAELLVERARSIARRAWLEEYVTSALLYAVAARVAVHRGEPAQALPDFAQTQRLRPKLTYALSFLAVQTRLELARAYVALTDVAAARTVLREADEVLRRRPDLGILGRQAGELWTRLDAVHAEAIGSSTLTAAELRLLRLLGTHHSFRGIGEQLYLSRHTVKSHAMSIYRKLGVPSRGEAIQRARELGLLAE